MIPRAHGTEHTTHVHTPNTHTHTHGTVCNFFSRDRLPRTSNGDGGDDDGRGGIDTGTARAHGRFAARLNVFCSNGSHRPDRGLLRVCCCARRRARTKARRACSFGGTAHEPCILRAPLWVFLSNDRCDRVVRATRAAESVAREHSIKTGGYLSACIDAEALADALKCVCVCVLNRFTFKEQEYCNFRTSILRATIARLQIRAYTYPPIAGVMHFFVHEMSTSCCVAMVSLRFCRSPPHIRWCGVAHARAPSSVFVSLCVCVFVWASVCVSLRASACVFAIARRDFVERARARARTVCELSLKHELPPPSLRRRRRHRRRRRIGNTHTRSTCSMFGRWNWRCVERFARACVCVCMCIWCVLTSVTLR